MWQRRQSRVIGAGVALALALTAGGPAVGAQESDESPLVVNSRLVTLAVTVTDGEGRSVTGLDKDAFAVFDDRRPQEIAFFSGEDSPASVGVVFDLSGSMAGDKIVRAREALARLAETGREEDEYFLVGFDAHARLLLDRTRDISALTRRVAYAGPGGGTALYDAVYLGAETLRRGSHRRRALVVVSDGEDNSSRRGYKELLRFLKEAGVPVYTVAILTPPPGAADAARGPSYGRPPLADFIPEESPSHRYYRMTLEGLAEATGGRSFAPHAGREVVEAFEQIALELRGQYSLGFRPSDFAADGRWRRLKVKVTPPPGKGRVRVRSREGYYAGP
jgi:Ca-activated chloride channel homolog